MKKISNVTVYILVYNEELRLESCLRSFLWADEIIVFDKHSTDRSREIASKFATEVVLVPFSDGSDDAINIIKSRRPREWSLFATASSLMHPDLADEILKLTSNRNFDYDVVGMPFGIYSLGIRSSRSPLLCISQIHSNKKLESKVLNKIT